MSYSYRTIQLIIMLTVVLFSNHSIKAEQSNTKILNQKLTSNECCQNFRGNINNDINDVIDISDLIYLVSYSFGNPPGPEPACFEEADVDGSGSLDISDIVYLVNYMFRNRQHPYYCGQMQIDLNLGEKVLISLEEESGGLLRLNFRSEFPKPCAEYKINYYFSASGGVFTFDFTSITPPFGYCFTVLLPATATQQIGYLPNGTYTLRLDNGASVDLRLLVTDDYYQILDDDVRQFRLINPILYKTQ